MLLTLISPNDSAVKFAPPELFYAATLFVCVELGSINHQSMIVCLAVKSFASVFYMLQFFLSPPAVAQQRKGNSGDGMSSGL